MRDQFSPLTALRPSEQALDAEWTSERRATVYARIRAGIETEFTAGGDLAGDDVLLDTTPLHPASSLADTTTPPRVSRRRSLAVMGGVAAAVAALLAVPLLLPSGTPTGPSTARALSALAAAAADEKPLPAGQFRHVTSRASQNGHVTTTESWTAADGHVWRRDTYGEAADSPTQLYAFPPGQDSVNYPSPAFLATLPTDPADLETYLRAHVSGSTSQDEAVFVAVADMLRGGFAPPALRAAALRVLERNPHITVQDGRDALGREATIVQFVDEAARPGEVKSLYFDPASAALLEESIVAPGLDFQNVVVSRDAVSSVPDALLRATGGGLCVTATGAAQSDDVCMAAVRAGSIVVPGAVETSADPAPETGGVAVPVSADPIEVPAPTR